MADRLKDALWVAAALLSIAFGVYGLPQVQSYGTAYWLICINLVLWGGCLRTDLKHLIHGRPTDA